MRCYPVMMKRSSKSIREYSTRREAGLNGLIQKKPEQKTWMSQTIEIFRPPRPPYTSMVLECIAKSISKAHPYATRLGVGSMLSKDHKVEDVIVTSILHRELPDLESKGLIAREAARYTLTEEGNEAVKKLLESDDHRDYYRFVGAVRAMRLKNRMVTFPPSLLEKPSSDDIADEPSDPLDKMVGKLKRAKTAATEKAKKKVAVAAAKARSQEKKKPAAKTRKAKPARVVPAAKAAMKKPTTAPRAKGNKAKK